MPQRTFAGHECVFFVNGVGKNYNTSLVVGHCDAGLFVGMKISHKHNFSPPGFFSVGSSRNYKVCFILSCDYGEGYLLFL